MENNRAISISTANSRKSMDWRTEVLKWSDFVNKIKTPVKTAETLEEFLAMKKSDQDELKDVGGFVGGKLKEGKRRNANILSRDLVTLDLDNIEAGKTNEVIKRISSLNIGYAIYSTRKHAEYKPRLRVVIPVDRSMSADEYEPVARKLGNMIGIDLCDPTTFEVARLMFWPSCSSNSNYVCEHEDKPFIKADWILGQYEDWKDAGEWPQVPGYGKVREKQVKKQQDPEEKDGVIGAFCKVFNICEAIERFIPDSYEISGDRLTYTGGSTYGGAIVYDDKFVYSHHATDPAGGRLCNAFDLVRLHKFSGLDNISKELTPNGKLPSSVEMRKLALGIDEVNNIMMQEKYKKAAESFGVTEDKEADMSWALRLEKDSNGKTKNTIRNIEMVLENDPHLKGKIAMDEFANRSIVLGRLPWDHSKEFEPREWRDADDSGLRGFLETVHGITGMNKINDGLVNISEKYRINEVKDYLESLVWDGKPRIETLLIDYFDVEDNIYTRQIMEIALRAAVARAIDGGIKFDVAVVLQGGQGKGKTTFFRTLGKKWFNNSLEKIEGKESAVTIQGSWIIELGEMTGYSLSEVNSVKHFLSKQEDIYRAPFGRRNGNYPRRCVFFGTTNNWEFLRDSTGDRRFWPAVIGENKPKKSVFDDLPKEVDQIWAEAYSNYLSNDFYDLDSDEAKAIALSMQRQHSESNPWEGLIQEYLERKLPADWNTKSLRQRKEYFNSNFEIIEDKNTEYVRRDKVCTMEIWCECLNGEFRGMKPADSKKIISALTNLEDWEGPLSSRRFGCYGPQKGFKRKTVKIR